MLIIALVNRSKTFIKKFGYFIINSIFLKCHGEIGKDRDFATTNRLNELYPGDLATGYKLNELRGAWHITFNN